MTQSLWPQSISRVRHVATERAARREIERARGSRRIMIEALRKAALNGGGGKRERGKGGRTAAVTATAATMVGQKFEILFKTKKI